jgi:hypothetical protein
MIVTYQVLIKTGQRRQHGQSIGGLRIPISQGLFQQLMRSTKISACDFLPGKGQWIGGGLEAIGWGDQQANQIKDELWVAHDHPMLVQARITAMLECGGLKIVNVS